MLAINDRNQYDNISTASTTTQTTNNLKKSEFFKALYNGLPATIMQQHQFDVTDNKTDFIGYNNQLNMGEQLNREEERLETFNSWPIEYIDKEILAKIGMYYYGDTDKVKCYFCEVIIGRWEESDDPIIEHIRWSPNCPLLKRRTTNNQPIDMESLDRILPPASYDVCGANDIIEVRPSAYAEGTIHAPISPFINNFVNNTPISSPNYHYTNGTHFAYPDHPEYAIESARLRSYRDCWPITTKQKPEQLSEAGFFYTGIGDRVKCFSCGGGLKDWDDTDDPWEQHALWLSNCRYLKLIKGSSFIDQIKDKYKNNSACNENELKQNDTTSSSPSSSSSSSPSKELRTTSTSTSTETSEVRHNDVSFKNNTDLKNLNNNNNNNVNCCSKSISFSNSNENQEKKLSEEKLCKICYACEYNTAFLPCGHVVACAKCASSVTKCPMCRKPFTDVMRVYFS